MLSNVYALHSPAFTFSCRLEVDKDLDLNATKCMHTSTLPPHHRSLKIFSSLDLLWLSKKHEPLAIIATVQLL